MNSKSTTIALIAALAVLSGALGMSMTGAFSDQKIGVANVATGLMTGHLEIEARNADGEIIAYRQTDNEVVDDGEQCILKMLFASKNGNIGRGEYTSSGMGACSGSLTGAWDVIAIGTTTTTAADINIKLGNETSGVLANYTDGVEGLERGVATTKTWTNGTADTTTKIVMSKTFTNLSANAHTIAESGLFNSTTVAGSGMLAHKEFTGVALSLNDSITITWTFIVGN